MIAYIHAIWLLRLDDFFGPNALLNNEFWGGLHGGESPDWKWTYLAKTDSLMVARMHETVALIAGVFAGIGFLTRASLVIAWFLTLMTAHRLTGFLFGLDQITLMLAAYLCLGQSGRVASIDGLFAKRMPKIAFSRGYRLLSGWYGDSSDPDVASWKNRAATRLMQIHLCIIYLFGGLGKLRGEMWWDGSAMWFSAASYEYQSLDLTWLGRYPIFGAILTHLTLFWEVGYGVLVWNKWLRPWILLTALMVHGGIALFLGMITFGWMMIIANCAFVAPEAMRQIYQAGLHLLKPKS